uniref:ADP,ATP carrier protein n=1 Tax=Chrysotila carterae TaxID=13221 RepID=A0A7S4FAT1_CHRCT
MSRVCCRIAADFHTLYRVVAGGAVGGVMRGFLETPAEFIKTRQQLGFGWQYSSVLRGLGATCLRTSAVIGVYFMLFEASRGLFALFPVSLSNFASGGICSIGAWALVYPLDTAKSRIQAGSEFGIVGTLVKVFREAGIAGLYAGMGAGLLRAFLANGGGMVAYGWVQTILDRSLSHSSDCSSAPSNNFQKDGTGSDGLGADREL